LILKVDRKDSPARMKALEMEIAGEKQAAAD
jgi:hypothetical protein